MEKMFRLMRRCPKNAHLRKIWMIMKVTVLVFFLAITQMMAVNVYSQDTRLSLSMKSVAIKDVLSKIEESSEFVFLYNSKLIDVNRTVSIDFKDQKINEILNKLFSDSNVAFQVVDRQIVLTNKAEQEMFTGQGTTQQQKTITGKVSDSSGSNLPGVSVVVKGTTTGTITDFDGKFVLGNVPANSTLQFSFVGMKSKEVKLGNESTLNVTLEEETIGLDEVVAIGYGTVKKSVVTGAISSIKSEDLANSSNSRAEQALQGKTAGVQVIQNSGAPGAELNVRIRGYGSNKSSEPIYIVNGTRVSSLSTVDPNNIKNIEVLKDAASAAIYGAEGANGVVLVTTKSGGIGKGQITYEYQHSLQSLAKQVDVLNAKDYIQYIKEAGTLPAGAENSKYDTNWQKEIFETTPTKKHYLSFTGGSERGSFMVSLSYLDQDGIVKGDKDKYKRYSLMFNSDHKINNWIKVGHSLTFSRTELNSISENSEYASVITSALMLDPLTPVYYKTTDEMPASVQAGVAAGNKYIKNADGNVYGISQYVSSTANPFVVRDSSFPTSQTNLFFGNLFIDLTPLKGLVLTSRLGGRVLGYRNHTYSPIYYYDATTNNANSTVADNMTQTTYWQWENYGTYNKSFGDHNTTLLLGISASEEKMNRLHADASPLTVDSNLYDDLDYLASNPTDNVTGAYILTRKLSYFSRLNYDYKSKYMFQFSLRRDAAGSDFLPVGNRWGTFPAASLGWVVSSENFFPKTAISFLKVRASWGQNGSLSNLGTFGYRAALSSAASYPMIENATSNTPISGTAPANLSNDDLKWETSEQTDFGIDVRAFKDRVSLSLDYYIKKTKDLLTTGAPILETGNAATTVNAGDVENRGFEFEASYRNKIGKLNYNISGNFATLHNEVTYMNPNMPYLTGATVNLQTVTRFDKGHPIWYFYGYKTKGIDAETGKTIFYKADGTESTSVSAADKQYIGSGIPKINYGFNLDLSYKSFDFKTFLQGASGHDVMLGMVRTDRLNFNKLQVFFDDRWTPTNHAGTMPSAATDPNTWFSDMMIFKGDYLKIKQIQLGYTISKGIMKKIAASAGRVYVSVENLHTFTKYPGADPEVGSSTNINSLGIDRGMYPVSRTILFGASITF